MKYRQQLRAIRQRPQEIFHVFLLRCRSIIGYCQYTTSDEPLMDAIIGGIAGRLSAKEILWMTNPSLSAYIDIGRNFTDTELPATVYSTTTKLQDSHTRNKQYRLCGRNHDICPDLGTTFTSCGLRNNLAAMCKRPRQIHDIQCITRVSRPDTRDEVFINLYIVDDPNTFRAKLDTGAQANFISFKASTNFNTHTILQNLLNI